MTKKRKDKKSGDIEPIEGYIPDRPEGEEFDVDIDVDVDDENDSDSRRAGRRRSGWSELFGDGGVFGRNGPFGNEGPFGSDGPFGPGGPFGPRGMFGDGMFGDGRSFERGARMRSGPRRNAARKRMFAQGELRLTLLLLIADKPRHGYELIKDIEELTSGDYSPSPGAVYPTLQLLADEGKIEEAQAEGAKKPFQATPDGMAELEERKDEVEHLMGRLAIHGKRTRDARSPDLFRAMGNLATVIGNRTRKGKLDKGAMDEIVDIIDEVAKRIERL